MKIQKILVPTDFSEYSEKALLYAVAFAQRFNAEIIILHVQQSTSQAYGLGVNSDMAHKLDAVFREAAGQKLKSFVEQKIKSAGKVTAELRVGNPADEIVSAAVNLKADLIITSTHGRTGLKHLFLGSVAESIIRHALCPVLVVRRKEHDFVTDEKQLDLKTVLVGVDFSEGSRQAIDYAQSVAQNAGAKLVLAHVVPVYYPVNEYGALEAPALDAELLSVGEQRLAALVKKEQQDKKITVESEVKQGQVGVELLKIAESRNADLIIVGTRGLSGLKHVLLGSTAENVLRHAHCPVLVVRG